MVGGILIYPRFGGEARVQELLAMDRCGQSVQINDQQGWVGRIPLSMHSRPSACQKAEEAGWEPHETSYLADVPILFRRMLIASEDRRHGQWFLLNLRGVDLPGLAVAVLKALRGDMTRGASTPSMQMTRMLRAQAPSEKESSTEKLRRKLTEFLDAISLTPAIGGTGSKGLFRMAARHLPCAQGTASSKIGGTVYGLADCARVLFNKDVPDLSADEIAIIIAGNRAPILFGPEHNSKKQGDAKKRWKKVTKQALRVIDLTLDKKDPSVADAKARIRAMKMPEPKLPQRFHQRLRDPKTRLEVAGNPGNE